MKIFYLFMYFSYINGFKVIPFINKFNKLDINNNINNIGMIDNYVPNIEYNIKYVGNDNNIIDNIFSINNLLDYNNLDINYNIIILLPILYLLFYTPEYVSNKILGMLYGNINLIYKTENNKFIIYNFNHEYYDGERVSYCIKNKYLKPYYSELKRLPLIKNLNFKEYQYLKYNRVKSYSLFTSTVANILKKIFDNQDRKEIKVAIVVSMRHLLSDYSKSGNYLKYAVYSVNKHHTLEDICDIHSKEVYRIKNEKSDNLSPSIIDMFKFVTVDYVFNSWRSLTYIKRNDGVKLTRINSPQLPLTGNFNINEEEIDKFYRKRSRNWLLLDYLNNYYIISSIVKF